MQILLVYLLKACIYSGIFFFYYYTVLLNKRFHYYNRFYLLMAVIISLLLPLLHIELWLWHSNNQQVIQLINVMQVNGGAAILPGGHFAFSWDDYLLVVYCSITLCLLLTLAFGVIKLFGLKRKYPVEKLEGIDFINTDLEQAPFSFLNNLFWKNTLEISSSAGRQIFRHELSHIQEKHSLDKLFMKTVTAMLWINPFYWLIQKELCLIHEFIADEKAIEDKSAEAFALMLLQSQYGKQIFSPAQSFTYSPIKRRLFMLTTSKEPRFSYVRRILVLPLLAITVLLFAFKLKEERNVIQYKIAAQRPSETDPELFDQKVLADTVAKKPLYFVDGKETTAEEVRNLDAGSIESINVLKDADAIKKYGKRGENGVVLIELKSSKNNQQARSNAQQQSLLDSNTVNATKMTLKVVDGKIVTNEELEKFTANSIESVTVLQGIDAVNKYGERGKDGVVEIITKNTGSETKPGAFFSPLVIAADKNDSTVDFTGNTGLRKQMTVKGTDTGNKEAKAEKIFQATQMPPSFPGGNDAWQKYLQRNLKFDVPTEHKAPTGTYTAIVSFTVDANGNLSDLKAEKDPGYGTGAEAVRVIQRGPKWIPAKQNGQAVAAATKQTITFRVEEN